MVFDLKLFSDLGKYSFGTILEKFDTERDTIYLNNEKIEITKIEDLFPFLWAISDCSSNNVYHFSDTEPWWITYYGYSRKYGIIKMINRLNEMKHKIELILKEDNKNVK